MRRGRCLVFLVSFLLLGLVGCAAREEEIRLPLFEGDGPVGSPEEVHFDPLVILRRAEGFYQNGQYVEAAVEYQHFLDLYPAHRFAPHAQFKLGMSYFRQAGPVDRDQEPLLKALVLFKRVMADAPMTLYAGEARKRLAEVTERLAQYEIYVGLFYMKKGAYPAAIARFENVITEYPGTASVGEALYYRALSHSEMGEHEKAAGDLKELLARHPDTPHKGEALRLLARINGQTGS